MRAFVFFTVLIRVYTKYVLPRKPRLRSEDVSYNIIGRLHSQLNHLHRIIEFGDTQCIANLRMNHNAFARLCYLLTHVGGLVESRYVRVEEKVAMFLSILGHHKKNRIIGHDYIRSGHTVSTHFHEVLKSVLKLHPILLVKPVPIDENCTSETWKSFKGCLGALDGTYINVHVSNQQKPKYRTRKGTTAVNILGVCDREMRFIYALTGWEGSAADARVLRDAIHRPNGFKVPRGMGFGTSSNKGHDKGKKVEKTRRVWTTREEEILLQALKEAISHGLKSENGFRIGYLGFLEDAMKKAFPKTDLRANPHINSKIHVWKKTHGTLMTLLSKSGIGWNETEKMIDATNEAWESIEKIDNNVRGMRYRSWPYYNDWCEIFGRDRATGEHAESFVDAVQEDGLNLGNTDGPAMDVGLEKMFDGFEDNGDSISVSAPIFSDATSGKKSVGKKRKQRAEIEDRIVDAMNNFSDMTQISIEDLSKKIGYDPVATKDVFGALGTIPGMTMDERVFVADKLVENPKKLAFFFSLPDEARNSLVKQLLKKE